MFFSYVSIQHCANVAAVVKTETKGNATHMDNNSKSINGLCAAYIMTSFI